MTPAQACRERGWGPGDVVAGPDGFGERATVRITAIGAYTVLARGVRRRSHGGKEWWSEDNEDQWAVSWAKWERVEAAGAARESGA